MPRVTRNDTEDPGHDSFLDIVANMVGILIILVIAVGVRVKNAPVVASILSKVERNDSRLDKLAATEVSLRSDVLKTDRKVRMIEDEIITQGQRREVLVTAVALIEREIGSRRENLDAAAQRDFDLRRGLAESQHQLDQLRREREHIEKTEAEPVVVKSYPTPLSRTVDDGEAHFQLREGRIVFVPVDKLMDLFQADIRVKKYKLRDRAEYVDTLGPVGGFRLKYVLQREEIPPEMAIELGYGGTVIRLKRASFIPVSSQLGEPVDVALAEGDSEFRQVLSRYRPGRHAITVWTYPSGFGDFSKIKKEAYLLGFSVAARPLPEGDFISGSPDGSKSAAQ